MVYIKVYAEVDKACDNIYNDLSYLSHLFYFSRLFRYNKICGKIYAEAYAKADKIYDNICDKCYYYSEKRFNNINKFNIKAFFFYLFLFFFRLSRLSRLSRYNEVCDKTCVKTYIKIDKTYNNICDKCYYYNKKRFNDINELDIKNIIIFFN